MAAHCSDGMILFDFSSTTMNSSNPRILFTPRIGVREEAAIWSHNNPDIIFGATPSSLVRYKVRTGQYEEVRNLVGFSGLLNDLFLDQMSKTTDDDIFAFTRKNSTYAKTGYFVYQWSTNRILLNVEDRTDFDEVQIDKSGRYLVVKTGVQGNGLVEVKIHDLQSSKPYATQDLTESLPDLAPGHSDNGNGVFVGNKNWV